nr:hypothetical protein [Propionicimonas sp.]
MPQPGRTTAWIGVEGADTPWPPTRASALQGVLWGGDVAAPGRVRQFWAAMLGATDTGDEVG